MRVQSLPAWFRSLCRFAPLFALISAGGLTPVPAFALADLDVTHISRTPLYFRYNVQYPNSLPILARVPGGNTDPTLDKRWPDPGERVTFTAHIRNHGDAPSPPFAFAWEWDGVRLADGQTDSPLAPGEETTVIVTWPWPTDTGDHTVRFVADPDAALPDEFRKNNELTDPVWGLSFSIWVEQGLYDRFNAVKNRFGTRSFEDWFRSQFDAFRLNFASSTYGLDPQGITEQVRVDKFVIMPNPENNPLLWRTLMANDPDMFRNDSRWQFTSEQPTLAGQQTDWDNYVKEFALKVDYGLLHEMTHQIGIIDLYRMNLEPNQNQVKDKRGQPTRFSHIFPYGGLMGGGDIRPHTNGNLYSSNTAHALNLNRRYRRGYFGEYLFDTPANNTLIVTDALGRPLAGASVAVFQKLKGAETLSNTPVMTGTTDSQGRFPLKNRAVPANAPTATGHQLRPNPFGFISVVGENGLFLLRIRAGDGEDWRWMDLTDLNLAYWTGHTLQAEYPLPTNLLPRLREGTINRAQGRPVKASSAAGTAAVVVDGNDATTAPVWEPSVASGTWWQVDLGDTFSVGQVNVYGGGGNPHDWYSHFRIETSLTGAFKGEQAVVARETGWDRTRGWLDQGAFGHGNWVEYHFRPTTARYIRLVSEVSQNWIRLQEVKVYEAAMPGDVTGDGAVTVSDAVTLLHAAAGLREEPLTPAFMLAGDIAPVGAPDGFINVSDAILALRWAVGLPDPAPAS